jgi:hypothetical protein
MSIPKFTALANTGRLVRCEARRVRFEGSSTDFITDVPVYSPVFACDPLLNVGVMVYRGAKDDSVRFLTTGGEQGLLQPGPHGCEGKWAIGVAMVDPMVFRATWILKGRRQRAVRDIDLSGAPTKVWPGALLDVPGFAMTMLSFTGWECTYGNGDGILDAVPVTRGGRTLLFNYPVEVNGRIVGHDGAPGAPNRTILADHDDFYLVSETTPGVQFPPQMDRYGNVALFEGQYFSINEILSRGPFVPAPPIVVPVPEPEPPPVVPEPPPPPPVEPPVVPPPVTPPVTPVPDPEGSVPPAQKPKIDPVIVELAGNWLSRLLAKWLGKRK